MSRLSMKEVLEAGTHFGHQTRRWNPKMKPYIFTTRNGIHIIDLQQTVKLFDAAYDFIVNVVADGGTVLFVGTKKQAQEIIKEEAEKAGMPYVNFRWLGGTLTNFRTIRKSVDKLKKIEEMESEGVMERLPKKEKMRLLRRKEKLERVLNGIRDMEKLPQAVFVVDTKNEEIAVMEAKKLSIPVVGIVDTNADPDLIDYIIPGNDDAIRSIKLFTSKIREAVEEGLKLREEKLQKAVEESIEVAQAQTKESAKVIKVRRAANKSEREGESEEKREIAEGEKEDRTEAEE